MRGAPLLLSLHIANQAVKRGKRMRITTTSIVGGMLALCLAGVPRAGETVVNSRALFPEGPVMSAGKLFYVEYAGHKVTVWDGKANTTLWKQDGCGPSAVVPMGKDFGVTCYDSGQLVVISAGGKTLKTYDKDDAGGKLQGPNDGAPDGHGGAYFTLSGPWEAGPIVGRVVHLSADGKLVDVADDLHYANGIVIGKDGRLYVNESEAGRTISFAIAADGSLSDRRLFVRLYQMGEAPDVYPDGIKLGPNGHFYIGEYSSGTILEVTPEGKITNRYTVPSPASPNLTFSDDGKTMYVTAIDNKAGAPYEGKVYALEVK
jgi:gluconolactonase